jgi:hypothetical protein
MEFENFVNGNLNVFKDEDDEILLNPIHFIDQIENPNEYKNSNPNILTHQMPLDIQNNKNNISINSTLNTNAALDESSQNINFNLSFISFNNEEKNKEKMELTQQSIEVLTEIISKEKMIVENNNIIEEDKKIKLLKIKELKNNLEKIDETLFKYFKRPYMRKNIEKVKIIKKVENDDDSKEEEEKKIDFGDDIEEKDKNFENNKINENFDINNYINEL